MEAITAGTVTVGGSRARKPATPVDAGTPITLAGPARRYVSRGGDKLAGAMEAFAVEVAGRRALDAGAGTGGFTHYLLEHGAAEIVALDVGHGQLDERVRRHGAVRAVEGANIRHARPEELGRFDLIVADLSFISLCTVAGALAALALPGADLVLLVKPQFEVGREGLGKGGVVRSPGLRRAAVERVVACLAAARIGVREAAPSPLPGGDGNREVFLWARRGEPAVSLAEIPV